MNINKNITFISLIISLSLQLIIPDGVYYLNFEKYYLKYNSKNVFISKDFSYNSFFRINNIFKNNSYYYLEQIKTKSKLLYSKNEKNLFFSKKKDKDISLWNITKKENYYIIQNINKCFIIIINNNLICDNIPFDKASKFKLTKIYEEVKFNKHDNYLIEKEPIDVLLKYIDLRDPELKRNKIHQIKKDYDDEELRYSIRSILKNIPWVRKIFILMPNKKVRFFKNYTLIKDKIIYVNDKDFLGYDSSNSYSFQFNYWKMYKYGISNNFIIMDDDYFIGKSLKKKDFFYVENGKVVPLIITSKFIRIDKESIKTKKALYKQKAMSSKLEQNSAIFDYSLCSTYLFIINIFKKNLVIPKFTHNAIPVNINELREIYKIVFNSEYKSATLDSIYRDINSLQFQAFLLSYTFIKFNKKVKDLSYKYIDIKNTFLDSYNHDLYCINTGGWRYSAFIFRKAKIAMNNLFPVPTPYENTDYTISNIAFNIIKSMEKTIKLYEENYKNIKKKLIIFRFGFLIASFFIIIICKIIKYFMYFI